MAKPKFSTQASSYTKFTKAPSDKKKQSVFQSTKKLTDQAGTGGGPSILGRTFDVLSRPLYGVASGVDAAVKGENPFSAIAGGLAGKNKTTFDTVLTDMGMGDSWLKSTAGFGLDIALDPTTYLGVGTLKGLGKGALGKLAAEQTLKEAGMVGGRSLAKDLAKAAATKVTGQGLTTAAKTTGVKAARQSFSDDLIQKMLLKQDKIIAENKGKVFLKFAGKPVHLNKAVEEGVYRNLSKISGAVGSTRLAQDFNKAFRPKGILGETHAMSRVADLASHANLEQGLHDFAHGTNNVFKFSDDLAGLKFTDLAKGELHTIQKALNSGVTLAGETAAKTGVDLEKYQRRFKEAYDQIFETEKGLGLYQDGQRATNYAYNYFKDAQPEKLKGWKNYQQRVLKDTGQLPDIAEATSKFGLNPIENAGDVLAMRAAKSAKRQSNSAYYRAVQAEFGIDMAKHLKSLEKAQVAGRKVFTRKSESQVAHSLGLREVPSKFLEGKKAYFPDEIASALDRHATMMANPQHQVDMLRYLDKVTNIWKTSMTTVNPGHHIRNMVGDVWNAMLDGVYSPAAYSKAADIMKTWRTNPEKFVLQVGDRRLKAGELMDLWRSTGGKSGFYTEELAKTSLRPLERLRGLSETREDWTRLAHFVDVLKKEGKGVKALDDAALKDAGLRASARVRKYHFDYGDLTPREKQIRKFVPFYTWQRKNIPLQIETLMMQPGKILAAKKGFNALQSALGVKGLPEPQIDGVSVTPQWLREMSAVRLAGEGLGRNGMYWNPGVLPSIEPFQMLEGGSQGALGNLLAMGNPLLTQPAQYVTGQQFYSGTPTQGGFWEQMLKGGVPPAARNTPLPLPGNVSNGFDLAKLLGLSLTEVNDKSMQNEAYRQLFQAKDELKKHPEKKSPAKKKITSKKSKDHKVNSNSILNDLIATAQGRSGG